MAKELNKMSVTSKSKRDRAGLEFEEVDHTADWALRIYGRDLSELLVNAARGLNRLLTASGKAEPPLVERQLDVEGGDAEDLLVNWLSELVYLVETESIIFTEFELTTIDPGHLSAIVRGRYLAELKKQIKAVTYHNLQILETDGGLEATVVFDV